MKVCAYFVRVCGVLYYVRCLRVCKDVLVCMYYVRVWGVLVRVLVWMCVWMCIV